MAVATVEVVEVQEEQGHLGTGTGRPLRGVYEVGVLEQAARQAGEGVVEGVVRFESVAALVESDPFTK